MYTVLANPIGTVAYLTSHWIFHRLLQRYLFRLRRDRGLILVRPFTLTYKVQTT